MQFVYLLGFFIVSLAIQFFATEKLSKPVLKFIFPFLIVMVIIFVIVLYCGGISAGSGSQSVIAENQYFAKCILFLMGSSFIGSVVGTVLSHVKKMNKR